jgi:hypothetical protein
MKTLVVGMQSSGASFVTFGLAQRPDTVAVVDLHCLERVPNLDAELAGADLILKCTITAAIPLAEQIVRFRPDRLVLVTRNIDDVRASLTDKPWRDEAGTLDAKCDVYRDLLLRHLDWFDEVIVFERFVRSALAITRTPDDILRFNADGSAWCRDHYGTKWGFGALRPSGGSS